MKSFFTVRLLLLLLLLLFFILYVFTLFVVIRWFYFCFDKTHSSRQKNEMVWKNGLYEKCIMIIIHIRILYHQVHGQHARMKYKHDRIVVIFSFFLSLSVSLSPSLCLFSAQQCTTVWHSDKFII